MAIRVTLDAMIPRDDFAVQVDEFEFDLFADFQITSLSRDSAILKLLRKPDFQRETNHWTIQQIATFVASFLDNEVIPSLILWKSPSNIFVIDGGHRLSALRAWMEDDYGDGAVSQEFYAGEIPNAQKRAAKRALDNEVIPSLILWKSPSNIFVIVGASLAPFARLRRWRCIPGVLRWRNTQRTKEGRQTCPHNH